MLAMILVNEGVVSVVVVRSCVFCVGGHVHVVAAALVRWLALTWLRRGALVVSWCVVLVFRCTGLLVCAAAARGVCLGACGSVRG